MTATRYAAPTAPTHTLTVTDGRTFLVEVSHGDYVRTMPGAFLGTVVDCDNVGWTLTPLTDAPDESPR